MFKFSLLAEEAFDIGNISEAKTKAQDVIARESGLGLLVEQAQELEAEIVSLEENKAAYQDNYAKAEEFLADKNFTEAREHINELIKNDLSHPFYDDLKVDISLLQISINKAEGVDIVR